MMKIFKSIKSIVLGTPEGPTAQVRLLSNIHLTGGDGKPISGQTGEEFTLSEKDARNLHAAGLAQIIDMDEAAAAELAALQEMLPPHREALPAPAGWENLPESFTRWHLLADRVAVYQERHLALEKLIYRNLNIATGAAHGATAIQIIPNDVNFRQRMTALSRALMHPEGVGLGLSELTRREYLDRALHNSADSLEDLATRHHDALTKEFMLCSDLTIAAHGALTKASRSCKQTAYQIFCVRTQSLGLADHVTRRLYAGSADYVRYDLVSDIPTLQDLRLAWSDAGSDPRHYLGLTVPQMASLYKKWTVEAHRIGELAAAAKKELAAAKKALAAAA